MVHSNENDTEGTMPRKKMGIDNRYAYLEMQYERYHQADLQSKSALLTEMTEVTGLRRKSLIRLMSKPPERRKRSKQRSRIYGAETEYVVRVIDRALDHPCRERLKPMLTYMADHLHSLGQLDFSPTTRQQLNNISVSSVGRLLGRIRQDEYRLRRRAAPASISPIQAQVPIHIIPWDEHEPGHLEVDLVFHSGPSATGEFAYTLQMVDVATGWSELVAILGRSYRVMQNAFLHCLERIPFPVLEVHTDNGSEFLNSHLLAFWKQKFTGIFLSRTRPYHSQDNRFVEHRNGALVRALVGHGRLDTVQQVLQLNRAYELVWSYFNYFQPVMRQTEKTFENGFTRRKHQDVRTPWQRVTDGRCVLGARVHDLHARFEVTNPLVLRTELDKALVALFCLPNAISGQTEDIFQTLIYTTTI